jgi:hypothetical protein
MKLPSKNSLLFCGLLLMLAAFPVFSQETAPKDSVVLNKRPLMDFALKVCDSVQNKKVDLETSFLIELQGVLTKEGTLSQDKSKFVRARGDKEMSEIAKSGLLSISDAGLFKYLSLMDFRDINILAAQNDKSFTLRISSQLESPQRAKQVRSGLSTLITMFKSYNFSSNDENNKDVLDVFNSALITADGRKVLIEFVLSKPVFQTLVQKHLGKVAR